MAAVESLTDQQCVELLASKSLGRLAFISGGEPEVFPVNYATDGKVVVFRTAAQSALLKCTECRVTFEVDDWSSETRVGWSVIVRGIAEEISEGVDPFEAALRSRAVWPLAPGKRDRWIAIYPAAISGRRFKSH